jgi:hypothetical protein
MGRARGFHLRGLCRGCRSLLHSPAHLLQQSEEEWQKGSNASIAEGDAPFPMVGALRQVERGGETGHIVGAKDRLVKGLLVQRGEWYVKPPVVASCFFVDEDHSQG